jgi:hypothetical protein
MGRKTTEESHPGRPADLRQHLQLVAVHESAQSKVGEHDVGIFGWRAEQEVLGFEICAVGPWADVSKEKTKRKGRRTPVDDVCVVDVGHRFEDGADEGSRIAGRWIGT